MIQRAKTPFLNNITVNFRKGDFDDLVWKKGNPVTIDRALFCPCRDEGAHQQSICRNCGGTGWVFINPIEERVIMHSMNIQTKFKAWSKEDIGQSAVTAMDRVEFANMDRITVNDSYAIFNEFVFPKIDETTPADFFAFLSYECIEIQYAAMFISTEQKLKVLIENTDFTVQKNVLFFSPDLIPLIEDSKVSVTIRYRHRPQFHILDVNREFMNSNMFEEGKEKIIRLPISAIARRAHYQLDKDNWRKTHILDNYTSQYFQVPSTHNTHTDTASET